MKLIQCPDDIRNFQPMPTPQHPQESFVFMAGGITGTRNWQQDLIKMLSCENDRLVLINPRRDDFDVNDPGASSFQIEWEFYHLSKATYVSFWFPPETLCPITLYELGVQAAKGKNIIVGCDPGYKRKYDVEKQLSLLRPEILVRDSLEKVAEQIAFYYPF